MPTVGIRTGDTPANERRAFRRDPPDILITTPESLYLMLTSQARETLRTSGGSSSTRSTPWPPTKRGAHLALSLERLERSAATPAAAHRPVGDPAPARGDRALPRRADADGGHGR